MNKVCAKCQHLILEEPHTCPTPAYIAARNLLITQAAEAEELFGLDDLEEHARKLRGEGGDPS